MEAWIRIKLAMNICSDRSNRFVEISNRKECRAVRCRSMARNGVRVRTYGAQCLFWYGFYKALAPMGPRNQVVANLHLF